MGNLPKRIALVYDRVNKWGGAESVLLALHDIFPQAPLYTSVYDSSRASWAKVFPKVIPGFINRIPFLSSRHELIPFLTHISFETFDFSQYEAVISVTSADAKGIVTRPDTFHLSYCLTPTRYLWSHHHHYRRSMGLLPRLLSGPIFKYLQYWDQIAAVRPDAYISISKTVQNRVREYYNRDSQVVYPPVDVKAFSDTGQKLKTNDYYLWIGRLVTYKRPDVVVKAFNRMGKKLVVIGSGTMEPYLKNIARNNVEIKGFLHRSEVLDYISQCKALIFFHEEDFGIVPVEAMAAGKPVIALNRGGTAETVIDGLTGTLIQSDTEKALIDAVNIFDQAKFDPYFIKNYSTKFSKERFKEEFVKVFIGEWNKYKKTL